MRARTGRDGTARRLAAGARVPASGRELVGMTRDADGWSHRFALVVVAYTLVAKLDRWGITGPMVFVAAGVILGPGGLDVLPLSLTDETVLTITELTLALLLFSDASTVRLRDVEGDTGLPRRLLFVGLPLTVIARALLAYLMFPEVGGRAALIATILAPTDAALGLAVVTNKAVPARIRRALNVESGLNDGIATPLVTLFIAIVAAEEGLGETAWGLEALTQIGLAIVAAVVVGYVGGKLLALANDRGWTSAVSDQIAILALALLASRVRDGRRERLHRRVRRWHLVRGRHQRAPGRTGRVHRDPRIVGLLPVWSLFGALFVGELLTGDLAAQPIIYALLSLTVIRMVPVAIALLGTQLRPATVAFMGWFAAGAGLGRVHPPCPGGDRAQRRCDAAGDRHLDHPAQSCCMASQPHPWLPGTGRRLPRRARSRRRRGS